MFNLTEKDYKELEDFLISDESPEECMDISMLDGFLTAILIGPETIQPCNWLQYVFRAQSEQEMKRIPAERMQRILDLIMTHYNIIAATFLTDPNSYKPMFCQRTFEGKTYAIIDEWCMGFMIATVISGDSWEPLIKHEKHYALLAAIATNGTDEGWKDLESDPEIKNIPHEQWVAEIRVSVPEIYRFWLPYREAKRNVSQPDTPNKKVDKDESCPCGSSKKFKNCCWQKVH